MGCIFHNSGMKKCTEEACVASHGLACCEPCRLGKDGLCRHPCKYIASIWEKKKAARKTEKLRIETK